MPAPALAQRPTACAVDVGGVVGPVVGAVGAVGAAGGVVVGAGVGQATFGVLLT